MYYNDRPSIRNSETEREWRKEEYRRLRSALSLPRAELSAITGLKISTLNQIPFNKPPSLLVLERMRDFLERDKVQSSEAM